MAVVVPRMAFMCVMLEVTPDHTAREVEHIIYDVLTDFGIDNIKASDIIQALNENIVLSDLSVSQRRKFFH